MPKPLLKPGGIRALAYVVPCPVGNCSAPVGKSCMSFHGGQWVEPHAARRREAEAKRNGPFKPVDLVARAAEAKAFADAAMPSYDPMYPGTPGEIVQKAAEFRQALDASWPRDASGGNTVSPSPEAPRG